jgi:hypothetical protein
VIWIHIIAQLATPDPAVEDVPQGIGNAFSEMLPTDSIIVVPPLFAGGGLPDTSVLIDPFWPVAQVPPSNASVVLDSSSVCNILADVTFYGTLRRNQRLVGLIGDIGGTSRIIGTGDSLRGGIVERISEDGIAVQIGGSTCLLERLP